MHPFSLAYYQVFFLVCKDKNGCQFFIRSQMPGAFRTSNKKSTARQCYNLSVLRDYLHRYFFVFHNADVIDAEAGVKRDGGFQKRRIQSDFPDRAGDIFDSNRFDFIAM